MILHHGKGRTAALVLAGACSTAGQVLLLRELMVVFAGHELAIGLALAGWLAGVGWGASAGARLQRRGRGGLPISHAALLTAAVLLPVLVFGVRLLPALLGVAAGEQTSLGPLAVSTVVAAGLAAFPLGLYFPGLAGRPGDRAGHPARAYGLEATGALAGGLSLTLLLALGVPAATLAWGCAVTLAVAATLLPNPNTGPIRPRVGAGLIVVVLGAGWALGGATTLDRVTSQARLRVQLPGAQLVSSTDSHRGRLEVARRGPSWLVLSDGQLAATLPDDGSAAAGRHLAALAHPEPKRVLLLTAVPCSGALAFLAHPSVRRVDVLVGDPAVPELLAGSLAPDLCEDLIDPRVRLQTGDPLGLLRTRTPLERDSPPGWDIIHVQAGDPTSRGSARLFSAELYRLAAAALAPGGVLVTSVSASANAASPEQRLYSASALHTLRQAFAEVVALPGDRHTLLAAQQRAVLPDSLAAWRSRRAQREPALSQSGLLPGQVTDRLPPDRVRRLNSLLLGTEAPVNSASRPVAAWLHLLLWRTRAGGSKLPAWLAGWLRKPSPWALLPMLLLAALTLAWVRLGAPGRASARAALVHMAAAGAAGMAGSLILLQTFQSAVGELYVALGLLVACFMAGLAASSAVAGVWLARRAAQRAPPR